VTEDMAEGIADDLRTLKPGHGVEFAKLQKATYLMAVLPEAYRENPHAARAFLVRALDILARQDHRYYALINAFNLFGDHGLPTLRERRQWLAKKESRSVDTIENWEEWAINEFTIVLTTLSNKLPTVTINAHIPSDLIAHFEPTDVSGRVQPIWVSGMGAIGHVSQVVIRREGQGDQVQLGRPVLPSLPMILYRTDDRPPYRLVLSMAFLGKQPAAVSAYISEDLTGLVLGSESGQVAVNDDGVWAAAFPLPRANTYFALAWNTS
jgi:hypothetical protein